MTSPHAHPAVDVMRLGHVADPLFDLHRIGRHVDPQHPGLAGGDRKHSHQHFDRRALAGPVGAEQAESAAARNRKRQIVHGQGAAEPLGQADKLDGRSRLALQQFIGVCSVSRVPLLASPGGGTLAPPVAGR